MAGFEEMAQALQGADAQSDLDQLKMTKSNMNSAMDIEISKKEIEVNADKAAEKEAKLNEKIVKELLKAQQGQPVSGQTQVIDDFIPAPEEGVPDAELPNINQFQNIDQFA